MQVSVSNAEVNLTINTGDLGLTLSNQVVELNTQARAVTLNTCIPGPAGPTGPPGPTGGSGYTLPTEIPLGGNRAIATVGGYAIYADKNDISKPAVGLSMGAVGGGADVTLQSGAKMLVTGAGWTPGAPVYLSTNGVLTQVEPTSGLSQKLGVAHDAQTLLIEICKPIILAGV